MGALIINRDGKRVFALCNLGMGIIEVRWMDMIKIAVR